LKYRHSVQEKSEGRVQLISNQAAADCNVVLVTSTSWSSAWLKYGMICSRLSLTRLSASGDSDWGSALLWHPHDTKPYL